MIVAYVEDNAIERSAFEMAVARHHSEIELRLYPSAEAAVEGLDESDNIDLVLIDVHLPGMSGTQLAQHLIASGLRARLVLLGISTEHAHRLESLHDRIEAVAKPLTASLIRDLLRSSPSPN